MMQFIEWYNAILKQWLYVSHRYSRTISALANTILEARGDLLNLTLMAFAGLLGFGAIGTVIYGPAIDIYRTLPYSVMNLVVSIMGKFDFMEHTQTGGLPAQVFLLIYLLCGMVLLLDIFITLLNEFLSAVKSSGDNANPDEEVIDYLIQNIKDFFFNVERNTEIPSKETKPKLPSDIFTPPWYPYIKPNPNKFKVIKMSD